MLLEMVTLNKAASEQDLSSLLQRQIFLAELYAVIEGNALRQPSQTVASAAQSYLTIQAKGFQLVSALAVVAALALGLWSLRRSSLNFNAHFRMDRFIAAMLQICSAIVVLITAAIVVSLLVETIRFFHVVSPGAIFQTDWSPQSSLNDAGLGQVGRYGILALLSGTLMISATALTFAGPVGLLTAIYLAHYAGYRTQQISRPLLEILAGIPTVVYGFFAVLIVGPALTSFGRQVGLDVSPDSALAAGAVMGLMITPYVSSLCHDAMDAVPYATREASFALGATRAETILKVILPASSSGILSAVLLAVSRTVGETMIVLMAAGLAANLTANPLNSVTTMTVQIVQALVGEQQFDSAKTLSAFMLGMILFIMTLAMNILALSLRRRLRTAS